MLACAKSGGSFGCVWWIFSRLDSGIASKTAKAILSSPPMRDARRQIIPLKANVDEALKKTTRVKALSSSNTPVRRCLLRLDATTGIMSSLKDLPTTCEPEVMDAEDPLFLLYTSGSTNKPKGVLHTTGGYLTYASYTHSLVFDYHPEDIYWCAADNWLGHGSFLYSLWPALYQWRDQRDVRRAAHLPNRLAHLEIVDKYQVSTFIHQRHPDPCLDGLRRRAVRKTSRKSLRLLGSVGDPLIQRHGFGIIA